MTLSLNNYGVIIPLCGEGKRFKKVGFKEHKSVLKIQGKSMLERVMHKFLGNPTFYVITTPKIFVYLEKEIKYLVKKYKLEILQVDDHSLGPAYSIYLAKSKLPKDIPIFISYCDITWSWSKKQFKSFFQTDAAIATHTGYHPHVIFNNFSAFCKPNEDNIYSENESNKVIVNSLDEIKEKDSFTEDWLKEFLSIGLFYVDSFKRLEIPLNLLINSSIRVAGEFFPSLLFNFIKENCKVTLINLQSYVHYGAPESFKDFKFRAEKISQINNFLNLQNKFIPKLDAVIYTSGKGSRVKTFYICPKHEIKINTLSSKYTLLDLVIKSFPLSKKIIVHGPNLKIYLKNEKNIFYNQIPETESQIESISESKNILQNKKDFWLCSCDCFGEFDNELFQDIISQKEKFDIICFGFQPTFLQKSMPNPSFTTFSFKENNVIKVNIKSSSFNSDLMGLAGFFFIKDGSLLNELVKKICLINKRFTKRELIADDLVNSYLDEGKIVKYIPLNHYYHLGSYPEIEEFNYWSQNFNYLLDYGTISI